MEEIIKKYKSGELNRDLDEAYQGGICDLANEIVSRIYNLKDGEETVNEVHDEIWQDVYDNLQELMDEILKNEKAL